MKSNVIENSQSESLAFLRAMPKVELHVHLEGATDAATVREMANRNHVPLPVSGADLEDFFRYRDFDHFVQAYYAATSTMKTAEDWKLMIDRFMANQAAQNIIYSEVFISASLHVGQIPNRDWIAVLGEAILDGELAHGVRVRLIPDISRELPESSKAVLDFVLEAYDAGAIIGLGLGGPEQGFPPSLYSDAFAEARRAGMHVVAHAGETDGPASVKGAWTGLGAERIGHGFRVLEDPTLTKEMAEAQVAFEVNPTSNYCIGVVPRGKPHPIRKMVDAGLVVTVNSDDPALFGSSLTKEYELLLGQGFTLDELWQINTQGITHSFTSEDEKQFLTRTFDQFASDYGGR